MVEKIVGMIEAYCFAVLEGFYTLFDRTHAVVALGIPALVFAGASLYLPRWVEAAIWILVLWPAATATMAVVIYGFLLPPRR